MSAKFIIGAHVTAPQYSSCEGFVTDMFHSASTGWMYEVESINGPKFFFREDALELVPDKKEYSMDIKIDIAQNVVIATLYESTNGETAAVVGKGHGHLIHEGELGIAQAASYACMRLYKSIGGFNK